jgi:glycosyltransferase involved in cell wall biosynthesis
MARILILGAKVPFTHGGQEVLISSLLGRIRSLGHSVDVIELPFNPLPKENLLTQAAMWRSLDLSNFAGQQIDLVIATKYPTYFARHPRKSVWLVHQLRSLYDLYGGQFSDFGDDPRDEALRRLITDGDTLALGECVYRAAISKNVSERLLAFNNLSSETLYPPLPLGDLYRSQDPENYILSVGRLCRIKRVDLMIEALSSMRSELHLKIVGKPDEPGIMEYLTNTMKKFGVEDRVHFLGRVSDEELVELYSRALGVYYAPFDEDYGYVTLEAMASSRPVVTATDSGGTLEFVIDGKNGRIVKPEAAAIGNAFNELYNEKSRAIEMGKNGRALIESSGMISAGWDELTSKLLSPLEHAPSFSGGL